MTDFEIYCKNIDLARVNFYPQQEKITMAFYAFYPIMICNEFNIFRHINTKNILVIKNRH